MKTIDLSFNLKDLRGKDMPSPEYTASSFTAGELLGNHLVAGAKGDALKYYDWAVAMSNGKSIVVDDSDFKKIRDFVSDSESLNILSKAQLLRYLDSVISE